MFWWIVGLMAFAGLAILVDTLPNEHYDDEHYDDEDWWDD